MTIRKRRVTLRRRVSFATQISEVCTGVGIAPSDAGQADPDPKQSSAWFRVSAITLEPSHYGNRFEHRARVLAQQVVEVPLAKNEDQPSLAELLLCFEQQTGIPIVALS